MITGLLVLGFGGHARSVADVALACGIKHLLFIEPNARAGENFLGHVVQSDWPDAAAFSDWRFLPASGSGTMREQQMRDALARGWRPATLIAPTATIGAGAQVGEGSFVAQHAHVGPMAQVGTACIVNTGAAVEHEVTVGSYSHISVRSVVAGRAKVGAFCFIGAGAIIIDKMQVADGVTLGAGGVAASHLLEAGVYVGVPARLMTAGA